MKSWIRLPIQKGKHKALIDLSDMERVAAHNWWAYHGYARAEFRIGETVKGMFMHRFIIGIPQEGHVTDHINSDRLDNRSENLRHIPARANVQRGIAIRKNNTSGYRGITYDKRRNKWMAVIEASKHKYSLGAYRTPGEAALAYNEAAMRLHGEYAQLNKVPALPKEKP